MDFINDMYYIISMKAVMIWCHAYFSGLDTAPTVPKFEELLFNEDDELMKQLGLVVLKLYRQFEQFASKFLNTINGQ